MPNLEQTINSTRSLLEKFVSKRFGKIYVQSTPEPKPVVCPYCYDLTNHTPPYATQDSLYIEIIKRAYLLDTKNPPPKKSRNCIHLAEKNEWTNQNTVNLIRFFEGVILQSCYSDFLDFNGKDWINVDSSNPAELIKLFSDIETMEFVILRHVDESKELLYPLCDFKKGKRTDYFYSDFKNYPIPEQNFSQSSLTAMKYSRTRYYKLDFFQAFANKVLKITGKKWIGSLDPTKYDYRVDFTKSCGRHLGNIHLKYNSEDPGLENREYRYFIKWKESAEKRLGRKFVQVWDSF